jgi:hypothetical protein
VRPGESVTVHWPMDDGSTQHFAGVITHCNASRRKKNGERFRYTILFADGDVRKSRLRHLTWCRVNLAAGPRLMSPDELPFDASSDDHCETPVAAYQDIFPVLRVLAASLRKEVVDLRIYDPYYCDGAVGRNLGALGFKHVFNEPIDFYECIARDTVPAYDVLLTNPPYRCGNYNHPALVMRPRTMPSCDHTPYGLHLSLKISVGTTNLRTPVSHDNIHLNRHLLRQSAPVQRRSRRAAPSILGGLGTGMDAACAELHPYTKVLKKPCRP